MRYVKKTGTPVEAEGKRLTKTFVEGCWNEAIRQYENLFYDRHRLADFGPVLLREQKDDKGNYCCYCMRKLFLENTADGHKANVTFEHIVPHRIKFSEWNEDKDKYTSFPNLDSDHITICFDGELTEKQKTLKMVNMPFPHYVSYHNLVASCDGVTFEGEAFNSSRCCNNRRQERFVMPIFLSKALSSGIKYTSKGELDYDDSVYDFRWFDAEHLNLTNAWITLVRRIWYRISRSEYTDCHVEQARIDKVLRQEIIDDVDSNNEISAWAESDSAWNLFSEYSWFYDYYNSRYNVITRND